MGWAHKSNSSPAPGFSFFVGSIFSRRSRLPAHHTNRGGGRNTVRCGDPECAHVAANKHKGNRRAKFLFFIVALVVGPRLVWVVNRASWKKVMQQVWGTIAFQATNSHPPGASAGGAVDLHHRPNGSGPSSAQSDIRRRVVLTVRSGILPVTLVIHGKCILPRTHRIAWRAFRPAILLSCERRLSRPYPSAKR